MKISYNWLQSYFDKNLPSPDALAKRITFAFAEVEDVTVGAGDSVFDIKILPDRACYALSHRGVAYEIGALLGEKARIPSFRASASSVKEAALPDIRVEEQGLCPLFVGARIQDISVGASPLWLREKLESIGQRSINSVVDATNFVMFDIGRPLHAFDADKIRGALVVRFAKDGESITTLDNKTVPLSPSVLVLADDEGPLAIAGIKGGNRAGVDEHTKHLIVEGANWDPAYIRKTAQAIGIKTDASKRFENRLWEGLAKEGVEQVIRLILSLGQSDTTKVSPLRVVGESNDKRPVITISRRFIESRIGVPLSLETVTEALQRLDVAVEEDGELLRITPPPHRLDLVIPEDIVEEVVRLYGLDKIPAVVPPVCATPIETPSSFSWEWKIREVLAGLGFSEIMTSSFFDKGVVKIEKPLAEDKKYARASLRGNFGKALQMNVLNAPFLGETLTRIFEIGRIFPNEGEKISLALGVAGPKKKIAGVLEHAVQQLSAIMGCKVSGESKDGVMELELDALIARCVSASPREIAIPTARTEKFTPFSPYPFIVRDIAVFVPTETSADSVARTIKAHMGDLVVRGPELFDEFSKEGRKSVAFRLIFQASDRTLTDMEVSGPMEGVSTALREQGWEVR